MQTVLRESLCGRVSGGKLDFPRHASFAAIKIVKWWEAEFLIAFRYPSGLCISTEKDASGNEDDQVIKMTKPSEFILLVVDTSEQLIGIKKLFINIFNGCIYYLDQNLLQNIYMHLFKNRWIMQTWQY